MPKVRVCNIEGAEIEELELVIEYLEKAEKIFSSTTYDLKNAIELMKMEQM